MVPRVVPQLHSRVHPGIQLRRTRNSDRLHGRIAGARQERIRVCHILSAFGIWQLLERRDVPADGQSVGSPAVADGGLDRLPPGRLATLGQPRAHEQRRRHASISKEREGVFDDARVTVVERDPHCALGKGRPVVHGCHYVRSPHRVVAAHDEVELPAKSLRVGHPVIRHDP